MMTSLLLLFLLLAAPLISSALFMPNDQEASWDGSQVQTGPVVKRPFCNAFTGCGRKRSEPEEGEDQQQQLMQKLSQQLLRWLARQHSTQKLPLRSAAWSERKRRMTTN